MNATPLGIERIPCSADAVWRALRKQNVTASVVGALVGAHEYDTPYSLYQHKTGAIVEDIEETDAIKRGRLLEPVAVQLLREEHPGWTIRHNSGAGRVFYQDSMARIGATPDVEAHDPERGPGVIQIKSVEASTFRKKWRIDGETEPPLWIAMQAIVEAHLTGAQWVAVAPLVVGYGLDMPLIDIPLHGGVMTRIRNEVADFWRRVHEKDPPPPDYARDGGVIAQLFNDPVPGIIADLTADNHLPEIAAEDAVLAEEIKVKTARRKAIKDEFRHKIGNCEGAIFQGGSVSAKLIKKKSYTVAATEYRDIRIKFDGAPR